jgi:hypothetical protein
MGRASGWRRRTNLPPGIGARQHLSSVLWKRGAPHWLFPLGHVVSDGVPLPKEAPVVCIY